MTIKTEKVELPVLASIEHDTAELAGFGKLVLAKARSLIIKDERGLDRANQLIVDLAQSRKKVKERMDFFTKPIKQHIKIIDGFFKSILSPMEEADDLVRAKIVGHREETRKEQEELRKVLAESGASSEEIELAAQAKSSRVNGGQVTASKVWTFTIDSIDLLPELVLRETANTIKGRDAIESVIRAKVKSGIRQIPGVKIYETEQLSVRE